MELILPLKEMTTEEKINTMELIWADLCKNADLIPSPIWHEQILINRAERVKDGNDEFMDWEKAKKNIRKSIPCNHPGATTQFAS